TARETMFSDAISSISSRWRESSSPIASAISGSLSASVAVNSEASPRCADVGLDSDIHGLLAPAKGRGAARKTKSGIAPQIAYWSPTAKLWHVDGWGNAISSPVRSSPLCREGCQKRQDPGRSTQPGQVFRQYTVSYRR